MTRKKMEGEEHREGRTTAHTSGNNLGEREQEREKGRGRKIVLVTKGKKKAKITYTQYKVQNQGRKHSTGDSRKTQSTSAE